VGPEIFVPGILFGGGALVGISYSPIGRAIARRIGGKEEAAEGAVLAEVDALREDLAAVRAELGEVQERLDFAERLLAQARTTGQLGAGGT
jgi:flagellin-like hook-associated protein FlgL